MRVLLVTPVEEGSGETITSVHMAQNLTAQGHAVLFLASRFACRFIEGYFPDRVRQFSQDGTHNRRLWESAFVEFRPDAVVFADYPFLFVPKGCAPLASEPGWVDSLEELDVCLVTLDHFGFAQRELGLFVGPPHLGFFYQRFPAIPSRMRILLPCPMHEPGPVEGRRGHPFRYWEVPLGVSQSVRQEVRRRHLEREDDLLVFHSVPNWAWRLAEAFGLPFYRFLPQILDYYFGDLPKPVTIVSVNNGNLLAPPQGSRIRIVNLSPMPTSQFEELLFGSDLVLTENKVSIAMGKAICGLQPCAVLKNRYRILEVMDRLEGRLREVVLTMENTRPGTVYPYEVFPTGMTDLLEEIILYRANTLTAGFWECEIYGGIETRDALHRYLMDPSARQGLHGRQRAYVEKLRQLGDSTEVLQQLVEDHRRGR